jgi:uncharacterized coiled-coil protein SlyX
MSTGARLTTLEQAMAELAVAQARTQANLDRLSDEMRAFKDEMRQFSRDADRRPRELSAKPAAKLAALSAELSAEAAESTAKMAARSNKMGTLAEDFVAPSVPALFERFFGTRPLASVVWWKSSSRKDPARQREFDVVAWGGEFFLVNETRSRPRPEDVDALAASLPEVRDYFLEAQERQVVGSLSAFYVDPTLVTAAERAGLYMFSLGSGLLEVLNSPGFEPRRF